MSSPFPKFLDELLANPPTAGTGVHNWLFKVSRQLHAHMGTVQMENFLQKNLKGCGRHVPIREIRDAIRHSASCAWTPGEKAAQNYFGSDQKQKDSKPALEIIDRIVREGVGLYDLWEQSPYRFGDAKGPPQTEMLIDALLPGDPLLCVGKSNAEFHTRRRSVWLGHLSRFPLIVPNPMTKIVGKTKDGRISEHTLDATGPSVWLVLEFDFSSFARDGPREAKRAQRAAAAAAHAEAQERKRRDEEQAAKAAALAAEAERERKSREPVAETGNEIELEILRIPPNPRMVICQYWAGSGERRCTVRVGWNANFRRGMKLLVKRPANGTEAEPWAYDGLLPRRLGRW